MVGLTRPEGLALGAATGRRVASSRARAIGWAGIRTPTVSRPAVASRDRGAPAGLGQDQGQGSRPEGGRDPQGQVVEAGDGARPGEIGHVDDQGVVGGPALGGVEARYGRVVGGDGTQAVDGLGREGHETAPAQDGGRRGDGRGIGGSDQARSRFRPTSVAARTRASLTASPRRNGSTPRLTAFPAPTNWASQAAPKR